MLLDIEPKPLNKISSGTILQQTPFWGRVKSIQGWEAQAFDLELEVKTKDQKGRNIKEDLLIISKDIGDGAEMAYIPYGPMTLPDKENRGLVLEELSENLRPYLSDNCIMIRYDLPWESPWAEESDCYDEDHMWMGPPEPRIREMRMNFGTQNWNLRKASTDILPSSTLILDLQPDYDVLLKRMKPKTRYNINLAKRKGVQVRVVGEESLDTLYGLYIQTAKRNNLTLNDISFFKSLLDANKTGSDAKVYMLLAEANGFPLAGMFMVITGNRSTYLFGASGNESRNFMGTYALQWEAIRISKQAGCVSYDMFGVSQVPDPSHPLYGLYRFKSGFGGQIYHRQGCWDYPFDEGVYAGFRASELTAEGYHI